MNEGCLSIPHLREEVKRESHIRIQYYDENWNYHDDVFDGYKARIIQHEYDHIEGILMVDRINSLKRVLLNRRLNDISKGDVDVSYKMLFPHIKKRKK